MFRDVVTNSRSVLPATLLWYFAGDDRHAVWLRGAHTPGPFLYRMDNQPHAPSALRQAMPRGPHTGQRTWPHSLPHRHFLTLPTRHTPTPPRLRWLPLTNRRYALHATGAGVTWCLKLYFTLPPPCCSPPRLACRTPPPFPVPRTLPPPLPQPRLGRLTLPIVCAPSRLCCATRCLPAVAAARACLGFTRVPTGRRRLQISRT